MITSDFPQFVTVLRAYDKFYPALMQWNELQERYELAAAYKKKKLKTDAEINAQALAEKLGVEYRP